MKGLAAIAGFGATTVLVQIVTALTGIVALRWIKPEAAGVWQVMLLVEVYSQFLRLGVVNAMNREYPFLLGKGEVSEAESMVAAAYAYTLAVCAIFFFGCLGVSIAWIGGDSSTRLALIALAPYGTANLFRAFFESTYRGSGQLKILAWIQLGTGVLTVVSLPVVSFWGFAGFLTRAVLLAGIPAVLCWWWRPVRSRVFSLRTHLRVLFVQGMPLFLNNYLVGIANGLPRTILGVAGGTSALGLYAPVASLLNLGQSFGASMGPILLAQINSDFGRRGDPSEVLKTTRNSAALITILMAPLVIIGLLILPTLVSKWLPDYRGATFALQIALLAALAGGSRLLMLPFSTLKAWKGMFFSTGLLLFLTILTCTQALVMFPGCPLEALAGAQVIVMFLHGLICYRILSLLVAGSGSSES